MKSIPDRRDELFLAESLAPAMSSTMERSTHPEAGTRRTMLAGELPL
jgi:hypothetical protein